MTNLVLEIGQNHNGSLDNAIEMIRVGSLCGARYFKFQKRDTSLYPDTPYTNSNSFGPTYRQHREALEFTKEQHMELMIACHAFGSYYGVSVWDLQSAKDMISLYPDFIKIPSARNTHSDLMNYVLHNYDGPIHVSAGMLDGNGRQVLSDFLKKDYDRIVPYICTSAYPCSADNCYISDLNLIPHIQKGYSSHYSGPLVPILAASLGADFVEVHFTLDRSQRGSDHSASLEPDCVRRLVRDFKLIPDIMKKREDYNNILPCEQGSIRLREMGLDDEDTIIGNTQANKEQIANKLSD